MLITLSLAAVLIGQTPPAPPSPPSEAHTRTRVFTRGGAERGRDLDKNGDGTVTRDEFTASLYAPFDRLDDDGDGRVEVEAFAGAGGAMDFVLGAMPGFGAGIQRFQLRRPGGRGPEVADNVMVFHSGLEGLTSGDKRIEVIRVGEASGVDEDGDGRVTEDEFIAPLRDAFRRLDKNGSGGLDADERDPVR